MKPPLFALPTPPADVLALFDRLPPEVMEKIQLQMVAYSMEGFCRLGKKPSDKDFYKVMVRNHHEFCRLIRQSAAEVSLHDHR